MLNVCYECQLWWGCTCCIHPSLCGARKGNSITEHNEVELVQQSWAEMCWKDLKQLHQELSPPVSLMLHWMLRWSHPGVIIPRFLSSPVAAISSSVVHTFSIVFYVYSAHICKYCRTYEQQAKCQTSLVPRFSRTLMKFNNVCYVPFAEDLKFETWHTGLSLLG